MFIKECWTDEQLATLHELAAQGLTAAMIGAQIGKSRSATLGQCHRLHLKLGQQTRGAPVRDWVGSNKDKLIELNKRGLTTRQIGEYFNVPPTLIRHAIRQHIGSGAIVRTVKPYVPNKRAERVEPVKAVPIIVEPVNDAVFPLEFTVSLIDLRDDQCHMPGDGGMYCGGGPIYKIQYCQKHYELMHQKVPRATGKPFMKRILIKGPKCFVI